ncbi:MAG: hypothetical protein IJQ81_13700 [Oscillibacter sp.]|nr:hypothetical protein [Oscillibacter sp.]
MEIYTKDHKPRQEGAIPRVVSEENGCKHIGINERRHEVRQFKVDGGIIRGTTVSRCDYLVVNDTARRTYFIELKGSDVKKAMGQLDNTLAMVRDLKGYAAFLRIVFRGTVNITNAERAKWENKHGGRVKIKRNIIEESICDD